MMIFQCDRCRALGGEPEPVRGKELCRRCVLELEAWLQAGPAGFRPCEGKTGRPRPRNPAESSLAVVRAVADDRGGVSARSFAAATGEEFRASYLRLRYLHRKGLIERVAGSVYRLLPEPTQHESEAAE